MNLTYKRIEWVDIAKGIAIMLVVFAHTIMYGNTGPILRAIIYSFHMPFFFIMSGVTSSLPSTMEEFIKKTKKLVFALVVPAYAAYIIREIIKPFLYHNVDLSLNFFLNQLYSIIFVGYGEETYLQFSTYSISVVWFLIVLFSCRTLLSYLNLIFSKQQLLFVTCLLSLIGYIAGSQFHMIFAFDITLTVLPFCLVGHYIKRINLKKSPVRYGMYALLIWALGFFIAHPDLKNISRLDIFTRKYPLYPLCFITAIAGTIFFCCCCILFSKLRISKIFSLIGKDTLIYLLIHYFDIIWKPLWDLPSDQYMKTLFRLFINTTIFLLIILLKYIFKKFQKDSTSASNNKQRS